MTVRLVSFSYKTSAPPKDATVFDCRILRNPYRVERLRSLTGKDAAVQDYVTADPGHYALLQSALTAIEVGQSVAFGCHGGKHRSVAMAEMTAKALKGTGLAFEVVHSAL